MIITKNEEKDILKCLESVQWADEIIVVDDESTDKTREIANRFTDRIFIRKMENEGWHRNWAYSQANNGWILSLDADERITSDLEEEITGLFSNTPETELLSGYSVARKSFHMGRWIMHGGWYPDRNIRLLNRNKGQCSGN